jgi:hypothetical protein
MNPRKGKCVPKIVWDMHFREVMKYIARWVTLVTRGGTVTLFVFPLFLISRMTFSSPRPMSHDEFFAYFAL